MNKRIAVLISIILILLGLLTTSVIYILINIDNKTEINFCRILNPDKMKNMTNRYASEDEYNYGISFNQTIMQANYVFYISPVDGKDDCRKKTCTWEKDPYGINVLTTEDYEEMHKKFKYDRGHLVPSSDYGYSTFIITNAVPMLDNFNRGRWRLSEADIRIKYQNKLIFKGCDYSYDKYEKTIRNNNLYIPIGCYYVVFDIIELPPLDTLDTNVEGVVLEYGYFENKRNSTRQNKKPYWLEC